MFFFGFSIFAFRACRPGLGRRDLIRVFIGSPVSFVLERSMPEARV